MSQHQLIIEYIKEFGSILPAKMYGKVYKDQMLGSETSKRCRELRKKGDLESEQEGKFERFWLKGQKPMRGREEATRLAHNQEIVRANRTPATKDICINCGFFMNHSKDCQVSKVEIKQGTLL